MDKTRLSRRDFFKVAGLSLGAMGSLAFKDFEKPIPEQDRHNLDYIKMVRVAIRQDDVYESPSLDSPILFHRYRDELVKVLEEFEADGPAHNPGWYRVVGGYMHTAHLAPVETRLQNPVTAIKPGGQVFQVTVPYTLTMRYTETYGWQKLYRLYYESNHWVMDVTEGPDGAPWYVIEDDVLHVEYMTPATHLRMLPEDAFAPITPEITNKKIEVSLSKQTVTCYADGKQVFHTDVSTGIPAYGGTSNGIDTITPKGEWHVMSKAPVRHMGDGYLTDDIHAYELPGVPWSTFFTETGVAFHGTYWHDNYGGRMSHGCVNMRTAEANWLYRWTTPYAPNDPGQFYTNGYGTKIEVF